MWNISLAWHVLCLRRFKFYLPLCTHNFMCLILKCLHVQQIMQKPQWIESSMYAYFAVDAAILKLEILRTKLLCRWWWCCCCCLCVRLEQQSTPISEPSDSYHHFKNSKYLVYFSKCLCCCFSFFISYIKEKKNSKFSYFLFMSGIKPWLCFVNVNRWTNFKEIHDFDKSPWFSSSFREKKKRTDFIICFAKHIELTLRDSVNDIVLKISGYNVIECCSSFPTLFGSLISIFCLGVSRSIFGWNSKWKVPNVLKALFRLILYQNVRDFCFNNMRKIRIFSLRKTIETEYKLLALYTKLCHLCWNCKVPVICVRQKFFCWWWTKKYVRISLKTMWIAAFFFKS